MNVNRELLKENIQLFCCVFSIITGVGLLYIGIFVKPVGIIDYSVLIATGELLTFAGTCLGIHYNATASVKKYINQNDQK